MIHRVNIFSLGKVFLDTFLYFYILYWGIIYRMRLNYIIIG